MAQVPRFIAEFGQFKYGFLAGADLRDKEGYAVTMAGASADLTVLLAGAVTEAIIGVIVEGGNTGEQVIVQCSGPVVTAHAGGTVTRGVAQMIDAADDGKFLDATGGAAGLKAIGGIALATAADDQEFPLLVQVSLNYYAA